MRSTKWLAALAALLACGLIAAGCGSDDETTSSTAASDTSTEATTDESTTTSDTSDSDLATPDDVYNACLDVIKGTAAESAGETACAQARDAFEQCTQQAEAQPEGEGRDLAIGACQQAAEQATEALQAAG
jgi:hypothetical protein